MNDIDYQQVIKQPRLEKKYSVFLLSELFRHLIKAA